MSDRDALMRQAETWLSPLSGDDGPCGPDLEYDNAFLELTKAAEGKPETQFERGQPPDWRSVRSQVEEMFERTRDLRVAMLWLRSLIALEGVAAFPVGMHLVHGLLHAHWDTVHPLPDPGDGDPYARVNALAVLPQMEGVLGDLLLARLVQIKGLGDLRLRDVEVAFGNFSAREGEPNFTREQLDTMFAAADKDGAGVRTALLESQQHVKDIGTLMDERFGSGSSADLKALLDVLGRALSLTHEPVDETALAEGDADDAAAGGGADGAPGRGKAGLSGAVSTRAEAIRAIDMVCEYLERTEPTNPAPLFLRRARSLLERNFLELLKELAPNALDEVARIVGVDPSSVGEPEQ